MTLILEAAAVLCLIYYGILIIYSGAATSFALFWPVCAACLLLLAGALHFRRRHPEAVPVWLSVAVTTIAAAAIAVFVAIELCIAAASLFSTRQAMDYVIVLGAKVDGTLPSKSLKKRLNKALEYAENNPNTILVLSGGQGRDEPLSEAQVMYSYLEFNGVPRDQLLMESRSRNTKENITFSKDVIERHERWKASVLREEVQDDYLDRSGGDPVKIGIITSNFHMLRAEGIARKQGIADVHGISAPGDPVMALHLWVRECFAILKDKFLGVM